MKELPNFPEFIEITLEHKETIDEYFNLYSQEVSEGTFASFYMWRNTYPSYAAILDNALILKVKTPEGKTIYFPPVTKFDKVVIIRKIVEHSKTRHEAFTMLALTEPVVSGLKAAGFTVTSDRSNWDYVYRTTDLIELKGRKYYSKRKDINKCLSRWDCEYQPITDAIVTQCLNLQEDWCNLRHYNEIPSLLAENEAIKEAILRSKDLGLIGGAILIQGKVEAFTLAERLNNNTAVVHFEKANPKYSGLYQLINNWFCRNALSSFEYVNREQDMGEEGLRAAKQSYHPHHMVEKYYLTTQN